MRGRSTFLWLTLAIIVGVGLFHVKYEVQALEEELARLNAAILKEQQQIHVLRAEWSYLNTPSRLEELAARHLDLGPVETAQIGSVSSLAWRPPSPPPSPKRPAAAARGMKPGSPAKKRPPRPTLRPRAALAYSSEAP
jgi:cell division protein FtsL